LDFPKLKKKDLQIKSIISLPSQYLPAGMSKYVSPLGKLGGVKEAANPPVSELESPKLKIAGNSQFSKSRMVAEVAKGMEKERRVIR
jgi:hypothetical protein